MNTSLTNSTLNSLDNQLNYIASVLFMAIQVINFSLGIPLNVYVIVLLSGTKGLDKSSAFVLSQRVSEILYAISAPLYVLCLVDVKLCFFQPLGFFCGIFISACPFFQCCVCLERYLAVVHPLTFLKFKPLSHRLVCLMGVWTCVLLCSFATMLTFPLLPFDFFGSLYLFILVVDLFCCASILKVLRQPAPGERETGREKGGKTYPKKKAFNVVFFNLLTYLMQSVSLGAAVCIKYICSPSVFSLASSLSFAVNIGIGFMQVLYYLHTAGKLTFPMCGCI